jgi:hypothetical protein
MKPVMFPYQLGMLGLCSMVYLASGCFVDKGQALSSQPPDSLGPKLVKASLWLFALWTIVLLPSLPHFWIYRADIFGYILGVAFESDFYKLNEQQGAQWSFHWLGYSGVWHLGKLNLFFAGVLALGLVLAVVPQLRKFIPGPRWASLAFLTLGAFGGIAINAVHQPWFGMTFQLLLVASTLALLASLFQNQKFGMPIAALCVASLGVWWLYDFHNRIYFAVLAFAIAGAGGLWSINPSSRWFRYIGLAILALVICYGLTLKGFIFQVVLAVCAGLLLGGVFRFSLRQIVAFSCTGMLALLIWGKMELAPYHNYVARTIQEAAAEGLDWRRTGPSRVLEVLAVDWKESHSPVIWCANYGWVDGNTISWEAVKKGLAWKVYNMGTIYGRSQTAGFELPDYADFIVVPSPGITGEIVTPYGIQDWNSIVSDRGNWELLAEVKAPKGSVSIYWNTTAKEKRDFSSATEWIRRCNINAHAR